jgi:predicted ArsR family transcriptional regulator
MSCEWNSLFNTPLIATEDEQVLIQEGLKKAVLGRKDFKLCDGKLKQLKTKNQHLFCPGCFTDLLESGDIYSFHDIASKFNLNPDSVFELLKTYQKAGKLKNVIDPIKKVYVSLREDYEKYLMEKILNQQVDLKELSKEMQLEERQVRLIILTLTKKNDVMGRFLDSHTYITDDLICHELAQMIKDIGSVKILEIAKKFRADDKETKRLISLAIKKGLVKAFYSPDSSTIIFGEGIQTKLLEILQKKGKIYIDRTAKTLGIHSNLLRNQIKQFIENGQVEGWYTQDRGFATLEHLKSEMLGILKLYEKISIKELVSRMFLPIKYVEILLQNLITEEKVAGALSDGFFKRAEIAPLVTKKTKLPPWMRKKLEAAENLQHILIIHKLSGTCLFSFPCSALNFDPDLVSGFLQAISSFGTEVSAHESGLEEIRYQGFVVALTEGELVRSAFICNQSPDRTLKSSIKYFTIKFEDEFRPKLEHWTGDISSFKRSPKLIEEYFKIGSKLLFLLPKMASEGALTKEKIIKKLHEKLKEKGRISLGRMEMELEVSVPQIQRLLMSFALEGMGRFTINQAEFVTEDKLNEEVAEIILTATEIPLQQIAQETKIGENEVMDFLKNLLQQGTIRGRIENRIFYRE